jgi:hypothetical protein
MWVQKRTNENVRVHERNIFPLNYRELQSEDYYI